MTPRYILTIDQGTTSSRALLVDASNGVAGSGQVPFRQVLPRPGWVEHDPEEIWRSVLDAVQQALRAASASIGEVAAIGVTNQRETAVLWDRRTGAPAGNAIVWQDRRTAARCEELRAAGLEDRFTATTGLILDPYFTGTKLGWLLASDPALARRAEAGEFAAGTIDSWLLWKLTGGRAHLTDYTNASRTLLFDIHRTQWDEELCSILGVPPRLLPEVQPSRSHFADTDPAVLGEAVPILGVAGDQQSAVMGHASLEVGSAKNTYGTGCFLLANAGGRAQPSRHRMLVSLSAAATEGALDYVLEGSVFVAGAAVQWLRDELGIIETAAEVEPLARSVPDSGGVEFVPAFTGLGAPHWDPHARGAILGLTRGSTRGHLARAALEAIALSNADLMQALEADLGASISELRVDGGAAANDLLMQMQADFAGVCVVRPQNTETTAMGAAYLAGIGAGMWADFEEVRSLNHVDREFEPGITDDERAGRLARWRRAVERARGWAEP